VESLTVRYGATAALDDVSFNVATGEILGIIGPNGAGKTSLFNALCGLVSVDAATRITLDGVEIARLSPEARCHRGLARTFQIPRLFTDMSVEDNLVVVNASHAADVDEYLDLCDLRDFRFDRPGALPLPVQRRVEIARALSAGGNVLLLDEVAAGLPEVDHERFVELLRNLVTNHGRTVLMVEHVLPLVAELTERVLVFDYGRIIAEGSVASLRDNETVVTAYLGVGAV
jgi:branched-chain amino acid transport system ATP-binding protein